MTTTRDNSHFVIATLSEFMRVWDLGEDASLHLETTKGHATMAFSCKLGTPSAPHPIPTFPPPPPATVKPRYRGPAQREKNRQRAALYQATKFAKAAAPVVTSSLSTPTTVSVVTTSPSTITEPVTIPSPITTSVSAVVSSPSLTTQETTLSTISSDAASAPLTGPVFGPSLPFLWSAALVPKKELPMKCDRCQYSNDSMYELRVHREKKHRLWECLRCDKTFHNQRSFDKHNPGPAKWSFDCDLHPFAQVIWSEYF